MERMFLGSARVSRVGFGVSPKQSFSKVRDREDAIASTRDACAPRIFAISNAMSSLRAFFEGGWFALKKGERFTGEMQ